VIDKDLASALLGRMLIERARSRGDDLDVSLIIFTAEDGVKLNYKKPDQKDLRRMTLAEARKLYAEHPEAFPAGSMGPKMKAVLNFLEGGGSVAYITKTSLFEKTLAGEAGTMIVP
jgi:carbamate kinase